MFYVAQRNWGGNWNRRTQYRHAGEEDCLLFGQCISLQWNTRRHEMMDAITKCFISITSANSWNSMKRGLSVGARGWICSNRLSHPNPPSLSVRVRSLSLYFFLIIRSKPMFRRPLDFHHHAEHWSITHLPLPWNAQETRVPFVTARNDATLLIALFTISFHTDSRLCALYIAGNTQEDVSMFRETPRFQKICDVVRTSLKTIAASYVLYFWYIGL